MSAFDELIIPNNYDEGDDFVAGKIWSLTRKINTKIEPLAIGLNI